MIRQAAAGSFLSSESVDFLYVSRREGIHAAKILQVFIRAQEHHFMQLSCFPAAHAGNLFSGADTAADNRLVCIGRV